MINTLLGLTLGWAAFALPYRWLLARQTFFGFNRSWLLWGMLGTLLAPFAADWVPVAVAPLAGVQLPDFVAVTDSTVLPSAPSLFWGEVLGWTWATGAAFFMFRIFLGIFRIGQIVRRAEKSDHNILISKEIELPFSFFKWVFLPRNSSIDPSAQQLILAHEQAHVQGWHSLDVLLAELLCAVFWWHPLPYWYRRELRTVHEYMADRQAARQSNKKQYGLLLIKQAQSGPVQALTHHFFQSPLKQRLTMLTTNASAPVRSLRYALIVPCTALLFLIFQPQIASAQKTAKPEAEVKPEYPGGNMALMTFLGQNIKYPEAAKKENAEGTVVVSFVVNKQGRVIEAGSLKPMRQDLVDEAIRVIKLTHWTPGQVKGKPVECEMIVPIKFKLED